MTQLTHNFRSFYIKLKDWREISITKEQKETVMDFINSKVAFIEIPDIDTWEILFSWKTQNIDEILERKQSNGKYMVICEYWNKHPLINWWIQCDCYQKYWFFSIDLKQWAKDNNKSMYMQDLTEDDKRECWKSLKAKWVI